MIVKFARPAAVLGVTCGVLLAVPGPSRAAPRTTHACISAAAKKKKKPKPNPGGNGSKYSHLPNGIYVGTFTYTPPRIEDNGQVLDGWIYAGQGNLSGAMAELPGNTVTKPDNTEGSTGCR
jgi:hypothetical protein